MRSKMFIVLGLVGAGFVAGCGGGYDAAINIKRGDNTDTLMGTFDGSLALIHGSTKSAEINVTDGSISCNGVSNNGEFSTNMAKNRVRHNFLITCDDGRTGSAVVTVNARPEGMFGGRANGVGVGTLSDGSKVRVVIGEMVGNLAW